MSKANMQKGRLAPLAVPGTTLTVRVTPNARAVSIEHREDGLRIATTAPPEGGKANTAVRKTLARALGIAPSRLTLTAGATSRNKSFRID